MTRDSGGTILLIMAAATLAIAPILFFGTPHGQDLEYHIPSWMEAAGQFRQGILFPRWAAEAGFGFGAPFFIFYPPLSWMIGGTLGLLLPWKMVPGAYIWIALLLAGTAMWKCGREFLSPPDARMAALLYAVNPYLLVMAYKRSAYGEALASALFPLLVWAVVRMRKGARNAVVPLAFIFAAIWLADLPAGVIATYTLFWLLFVLCLVERSGWPFATGVAAIAAGFGVAAFDLLPALWERSWVNIRDVVTPQYQAEHNFLFALGFPILPTSSFGHGLALLAIFLIATFIAALLFARQLRTTARDVWSLLTALGGISIFMMLPPSLISWRLLPELRFVQFPWRWLSFLSVALVLLASAAISGNRRRRALWVTAWLAVAALAVVIFRTSWWDSAAVRDFEVAVNSGAGYSGATEYSPLDTRPLEVPRNAPRLIVMNARAANQAQIQLWSPELEVFSVSTSQSLLVRLKLFAYPAWRAKINGRPVDMETDPETRELLLPVPSGFSRSEILFVRTRDRTAGAALSLASLLALVTLALYRRRLDQRPQ